MSGIDTGRSGLEGDFSIEVLADVVPEGWVLEALGDMGPRKLRGRTLSAPFMVWFVILVAVNLQSAFLTPPFGFALFYMKATVPPEVTLAHIYRGIVPFVLLQVVTLAMCILWPEIVLILPRYFGFLS